MRQFILLPLFFLLVSNCFADRIYIMNSPGYNEAAPNMIAAMQANGHTVTVNTTSLTTLPTGFTSRCTDPVNGYDWLCFFGNDDFSSFTGLPAQIKNFIDVGGKVFYQYEISCCVSSAMSAATIASFVTGTSVSTNANPYIAFSGTGTGGWQAETLSCCAVFQGDAYQGMDGVPVANQLIATTNIAGSTPLVSVCPNFGFYFTTTDFAGSANKGGFIGVGDVNVWFHGGEPFNTVDQNFVDFLFPNATTACYLFPPGCLETFTGPSGGVSGSVSSNSPICPGQTLILSCTSGAATSYSWTGPNGFTSTQDNPQIPNAQPVNSGTYFVTISDGTCSTTLSVSVTIGGSVTGTIGSNAPICAGQQLDLTSSAPTGSTYSWTGPNGFTSTLQNPSIPNAQAVNEGTYTVVISLGGCSSTLTTNVSLSSSVPPTVNTAGPFCLNAPAVTLTASVAGGTWSGPGITNPATGAFDPSVAGIGTHTITYTTSGACGGSDSQDIVVSATPVLIAPNVTTCPGKPVVLEASGADSYLWSPATGLNTTIGSQVTAVLGGEMTYLVIGSSNGCSSSASVHVFMNLDFVVSGSASPNPINEYENTVQLTAGPNTASFYWIFENGATSTEPQFTHEFPGISQDQDVILIGTSPDGCIDTVRFRIYVEDDLIFYVPNTFTPNADQFNTIFLPVFTQGFDPDSFEMLIFNRWGELVFETHDYLEGWDGTYDGQMVQDGVYSWKISFKSDKNDEKFEVQGHVNKLE